ncbi:MAG: RtcB family protein [Candidatus Njordarchaeales archaeon]
MSGTRIEFTQSDLFRALKKIKPNVWEIPKGFRPFMRVPARIYMTEKLLRETELGAIQQIINVASLPGIVKYSIMLPDGHWGYGFPIGGVAAFDVEDEGIISPGGIGYDINCGVRFLVTNLRLEDVEKNAERLLRALSENVPAGVGRSGHLALSVGELEEVMVGGAEWAVEKGYGYEEDLRHIEDGGRLKGADPSKVSPRAKKRGRPQLGTLGSGNHYLEVEVVEEIFDPELAKRFGIEEVGQIGVMIHTGSRGFGHQIASDYIEVMRRALKKYGFKPVDIQLAFAPFNSPEGQDYFAAMKAGANFAYANRQIITHLAREAFKKIFGDDVELKLLYDVAHNIGKIEKHEIDGEIRKLIVHRKGATRGFGPGRPEIPEDYRDIGQPILIGGNMLQGSYILVGTDTAMKEVFGSTVHGAGRRLSRARAKKKFWGGTVQKWLKDKGILVEAASKAVLAEEAPDAYKNLHEVIDAAVGAGIAKKVFRTRPVLVWKG